MSSSKVIDTVSWLDRQPMQQKTVLIVLNQPIADPAVFQKAWDTSFFRVVTDGGANRLKECAGIDHMKMIPDLIVGDFDSIDPLVKEWYVQKGVRFVTDESVYATDFMKAMAQSHKILDPAEGNTHLQFLAFGALGGRVDHSWHSYLCMSLASQKGDFLILVSELNVTFLLPPGRNVISTPLNLVGETCGYAPLEGSATVTTGGFEWDVENYYESFTTRLSTSNHLKKDEVWIETDKPLVFTVEIRQRS